MFNFIKHDQKIIFTSFCQYYFLIIFYKIKNNQKIILTEGSKYNRVKNKRKSKINGEVHSYGYNQNGFKYTMLS